MKALLSIIVPVALVALGSPAPAQAQPRDTGNMAYPAPLPQGNLTTTRTARPARPTDTGNMTPNTPSGPGGRVTTTTRGGTRPTDTGNMTAPTQGLPPRR